jgi:L,D-transpeptidase catalytic domain
VALRAKTSVEIDLQEQMAYLLQNGRPVLASPISSGRYGHLTKTGSFTILEKERTHYWSMYGKIVDARGNIVVADADADMQVPRGPKVCPCANELLHALSRCGRNARRVFAWLPCLARLRPHA